MCIVCHYKSDSVLVTREVRAIEHSDGAWACIRYQNFNTRESFSDSLLFCFDCKQVPVTRHHVCGTLPQVKHVGTSWRTRSCPSCGSPPYSNCIRGGRSTVKPCSRRYLKTKTSNGESGSC